MNNKLLSLLGFATRAGKLSFGFDMSVEALKRKKSHLVLIAEDISEKSRKEVTFFAEKAGVRHIILEGIDCDTVSKAVGKKCGIISVNDAGFANACLKTRVEGGNANDQ